MLHDEIAEKLKEDLSKYPEDLPTIRELARYYAVSHTTMNRALQILRTDGLLQFRKGQAIKKLSQSKELLVKEKTTKIKEILESIKNDLAFGTYRKGNALPKISYFVNKFKSSPNIVCKVFRELEKAKAIYKQGKYWFAGTPEISHRISITYDPKVICIFTKEEHSWRNLGFAERISSFIMTFSSLTERAGIQFVNILCSSSETKPISPILCGMEKADKFINQLGSRYLGSCIAVSLQEEPNLQEWASFLTSKKKPIIWFDRYGEYLKFEYKSPYFFTCAYSEENALQLALLFLSEFGHTCIGYVDNFKWDWAQTRYEKICKLIKNDFPNLIMICYDPIINQPSSDEELAKVLTTHLQNGLPHEREIIKKIIQQNSIISKNHKNQFMSIIYSQLPELLKKYGLDFVNLLYPGKLLTPYLANKNLTALIMPSDQAAIKTFYWLHAAGISFPQDLSLISFDNSRNMPPPAITTIDFGFEDLGHTAFHLLLQDIPIQLDKSNVYLSKPHIVRRGTVGLPRKSRPAINLKGTFYEEHVKAVLKKNETLPK